MNLSTLSTLPTIMLIISGAALLIFLLYLHKIFRELSSLREKNHILEENLKELDHQARLIIKNDMDLKLYQSAVQDKLEKLSFLKGFISSTINTLVKEELFAKIDKEVIHAAGFQNGGILTFPEMEARVTVGLSADFEIFTEFLNEHRSSVISLSQISSDSEIARGLKKNLSYEEFLIGPIITSARVQAFFILHKSISSSGITNAEKEVFSILCMYLGQCLDNITSFEAAIHAGEEIENKKENLELSRELDEAKKISAHKSDFISSVSHELRTPLTSIKGFSSLLAAEKFGILPPAAKERLKKIDHNVNKLVDMVNMLLDISRIESGRTEMKFAPSDICKLIHEAADFLTPLAENKKMRLKLITPAELSVHMDKTLIERVFINLINNAIKFTPSEGEITINCRQQNGEAIISISDTGYGIPQTDLKKIFNEFYRVDNPMNREVKGSGLGLPLVKKVIESHKQKIWVESKINKGTTFYFTLKVVKNV